MRFSIRLLAAPVFASLLGLLPVDATAGDIARVMHQNRAVPSDNLAERRLPLVDGRVRLLWDYHGLAHEHGTVEATSHPELEIAISAVAWETIEPQRGVFEFDTLENEIAFWTSRAKSVVLRTSVLGTGGLPAWGIAEGVPYVDFRANPRDVATKRVPLVWDSPQFLEIYREHVEALADAYDGDPRLSHVWIGIGHLGLTTADSTEGGRTALPQAGWTPEKWLNYMAKVISIYRASFTKTPLLLAASPLWTRDHRWDAIASDMQEVAASAALDGISLFLRGISPDPIVFERAPFGEMLEAVDQLPLRPDFMILFGDDWPLWVDETRRANNPYESDRDETGFASALEQILLEWTALRQRVDIGLVLLRPEIEATTPGHERYREEVRQVLDDFLAASDSR